MSLVYNWIKTLPPRLLPPVCVLCGAPGDRSLDLCSDCLRDLPFNTPACPRCAAPLPFPGDGTTCGPCQTRPPPYRWCRAALRYEPPVRTLVRGFKYGGRLAYGRVLAELLAHYLAKHATDWPQMLIPVPIHRSRLAERGFNQAAELAKLLSAHFGIPMDLRSLIRHRATKPQPTLDRSERRSNVLRAFRLRHPLAVEHVAIIDDVVTTGHTVQELAKTLLRGGVETVQVWACARRADEKPGARNVRRVDNRETDR